MQIWIKADEFDLICSDQQNQIMSLIAKPNGFPENHGAHLAPLSYLTQSKLIESKEEETLFGMCLKSLIKERMIGNLISYSQKNPSKRNSFHPSKRNSFNPSSIPHLQAQKKHSSALGYYQTANKRLSSFSIISDKEDRYKNHPENQEQIINYPKEKRKKISQTNKDPQQLENTTKIQKSKHFKRRNYSVLENSSIKIQNNTIKGSTLAHQDYGSGFISAIEELNKKQISKDKAPKKMKIVLPILQKKQLLKKIAKVEKSPKMLFEHEFNKLIKINQNTWKQFCVLPQKNITNKSGKFEENTPNKIIASENILNTSNLLHIQSHLIPKSLVFSEKSILKLGLGLSNNLFLKQSYLNYLDNEVNVSSFLIKLVHNFFEFGTKLYDEIQQEDYKKVLSVLVKASPRVWSTICFRFWDNDKNGFICSNDMFAVLKRLNAEEEKYANLKERHEALKYINLLKETMDELRTHIFQEKLLKAKESKPKEDQQIKYLEESFLQSKEILFSDLVLILGDHVYLSVQDIKKSVIQMNKNIGIKFSSCYRFSFLATDHNEQTRQNRQKIESLKQQLKNYKQTQILEEQENQLEFSKVPHISYAAFHEGNFYLKMKKIIIQMFGIMVDPEFYSFMK